MSSQKAVDSLLSAILRVWGCHCWRCAAHTSVLSGWSADCAAEHTRARSCKSNWLVTQHCLSANCVELLQPTTRSLSRVRQAQRPCRPLRLQTSSLTQHARSFSKQTVGNHEPQAARRKRSPGLPPQLEGLRPATAVRMPHLFIPPSELPNLNAFQPFLSSLQAFGRGVR